MANQHRVLKYPILMKFLKEEFNLVQVIKIAAIVYGIWRLETIVSLLKVIASK